MLLLQASPRTPRRHTSARERSAILALSFAGSAASREHDWLDEAGLARRDPCLDTLAELGAALAAEVDRIPLRHVQSMYNPMPNRVLSVTQSGSYPIIISLS